MFRTVHTSCDGVWGLGSGVWGLGPAGAVGSIYFVFSKKKKKKEPLFLVRSFSFHSFQKILLTAAELEADCVMQMEAEMIIEHQLELPILNINDTQVRCEVITALSLCQTSP